MRGVLGRSLSGGMILFSSKLISKTGSINHSLLGLLLRILGSLEHGINFSLESVDLSLQASLDSHFSAVGDLHLIASISGVRDFHIKLALGSFSRVKESTAPLLHQREQQPCAQKFQPAQKPVGAGEPHPHRPEWSHGAESGSLIAFRPSELALLAWSSPISSSLISPSSFFLMRRASALALCSASREAPRDSIARWWFLRVLLNSSSFSATLLSISWRTWLSSS